MRKCIVVSDSFKGTLSSREICAIAREVIPSVFPACEVVTVPVADGGEGTVDCFVDAIGAEAVTVTVRGPLGDPVEAVYARKGPLAVVEMAAAAGLPLAGRQADPELATTYGVGQLIRHAVEHGAREVILGLGGSATNDGGCGCAAALGTRFMDSQGQSFVPAGASLSRIHRIDTAGTETLLKHVHITAMCDIDNPLFGPAGAAYVFAPQKGADPLMVDRLDGGLRMLDRAIRKDLSLCVAELPGAGAAGGMGAGCVAFLGAELKPGITTVLDTVGFDALVEEADLVITGEGRIDSQSVRGKVISGIAERTKPRGIPLVAIVGAIDESAAQAYDLGVTAMFSINRKAMGFAESAPLSAANYRRTLEDILRLVRAVSAAPTH